MIAPEQFLENLNRIEGAIREACRRAGRARGDVRLMAVTKMHPSAAILQAVEAGILLFGENKVQEFESKRPDLESLLEGDQIAVHLIGHLQTNKAARAAALFSSIDTLDSVRLAERLNSAAGAVGRLLPVMVEIKLSPEANKFGIAPDSPDLERLLERLADLEHLCLRGLMTVPPYLREGEAVRPYFRRLRTLRDQLAQRHPKLNFAALSMGMTHDFAVAIEEGATEVRLGTALFGPRPHQ